MNPDKQKQLNENWELYCKERERMEVEGKPIGTFSAWQFEKKLVSVVIPMTREEHFGLGK